MHRTCNEVALHLISNITNDGNIKKAIEDTKEAQEKYSHSKRCSEYFNEILNALQMTKKEQNQELFRLIGEKISATHHEE